MHVGVLQIELLFPDAQSLKDKRRVIKSLKDTLHRRHLCAIAEVGSLDHMRRGILGASVVAKEAVRCATVLDAIQRELDKVSEARIGEVARAVIPIEQLAHTPLDDNGQPILDNGTGDLNAEMLLRAQEAIQ